MPTLLVTRLLIDGICARIAPHSQAPPSADCSEQLAAMPLHHVRPSHHAACFHSSTPREGNLVAAAAAAAAARTSGRRSRRSSRVGAAFTPGPGAPPSPGIVCFELDAVVQGLEPLVTAWALAANARVCPEIAACGYSPGVYTRHMCQLLPALERLQDAPLLLRLLHEEGIVGARSTAGREGPVVGRTVRRPLLVNEVLEHWRDEILPTCTLRWSQRADADAAAAAAAAGSSEDRRSRSSTSTSSIFEQQMQDAFEQAQASTPWRVLDTAQQQHGSSSSSSSGQPVRAQPAAGARTSQQPAAAVTGIRSTSVAVLTAPAPAAAPAAQADQGATTAVVQPHVSIVQCINSCRQQVFVASTYPPAVTKAALAAVQLRDVHVLHGSSMQACVQQLEQQLPAAAAPRQALLVLSSPNRAADLEAQEQLGVQVGEWACRAPSLRAKALAAAQCGDPGDSGPTLGLLSECALAELLGVAECEAVMDGIDWRQRADA